MAWGPTDGACHKVDARRLHLDVEPVTVSDQQPYGETGRQALLALGAVNRAHIWSCQPHSKVLPATQQGTWGEGRTSSGLQGVTLTVPRQRPLHPWL